MVANMPGVALLDALLHHVPDLVGILAPDGRYLYTGPAYERVLGYPPSTLTGKSSLGYVHPDDMPAMQDALRRVTASDGATAGLHLRHRHAGGSWRELETTLTSHLKDPAVRGIVISSREPAEHADRGPSLAELHGQELDTTLAAICDARSYPLYVLVDREGGVVGVQKGTARESALPRLLSKAGLDA